MKLLDIAKQAGAALFREAVPGGSLILDGLNAFLPDNKKLGPNVTGDEMLRDLPPEVLNKQFDVELEMIRQAGETNRAMLVAEANSKQTTRPKIALGAFRVVAFITLLITSMWAVAVWRSDEGMLETIVDGWPFVLALIGPFVGWLNSYFGKLRDEHRNRLEAVTGVQKPHGFAKVLHGILNTK